MAGKVAGRSNRTTAQAANQQRRSKRRRGRRTLHHMLMVLFVLSIGIVLSLTVFFKVKAVTVIGTDYYIPEEIAAFTAITEGDSLLRIVPQEIEENLLSTYPYIESVEVRRRMPSTVEVEIVQSEPAAALLGDDEYTLITKSGKILERGLILIPPNIPLVKGIDAGTLEPGQYLGDWEKEAPGENESAQQKTLREQRNSIRELQAQRQTEDLWMLQYLFQAMAETGFYDITNVDLTDPLNMRIMYENRMLLKLGSESELPYKLQLIRTALDSLPEEAHGQLDASDAYEKKIVFRPADHYDSYGYSILADKPVPEETEEEAELLEDTLSEEGVPAGDEGQEA